MKKIVTKNTLDLLKEGVDHIADVVTTTLGPKGNTVIIQSEHSPEVITVTKDGVTVAKAFGADNTVQSLAAQIVKQAANKTASVAGDGTTTTVVLTQAIVEEAVKMIKIGMPAIDVKRQIEKDLDKILSELELLSSPVKDESIVDIATISANNDSFVGELVAKAFEHVGRDGIITVEDAKTDSTYVRTVDGYSFNTGYVSPYFVNTDKQEVIFEDALVLVTDKKVRAPNELVPILNQVLRASKPLVIIADDFEAQVLSMLILNKLQTGFPVVAIKAPAYGDRRGELLQDISIFTGAECISDMKAQTLEQMSFSQLGSVKKIVVTKNETIIINAPNEESLHTRIDDLKYRLAEASDEYTKEKLTERIAKLQAKVAVIYVGAATEAELQERKFRVDDALRATYSAVQKGFVPGAGKTLLTLSDKVESGILNKALKVPFKKIISNAGLAPEAVMENLKNRSSNIGFDSNNYEYVDLVESGIIDPTLVIEQALINSVSAATSIIMTSATIHNEQNLKVSTIDGY